MIENEIFSRFPLQSCNAYFRNITTHFLKDEEKAPEHVLKSALCKFLVHEVLVSSVSLAIVSPPSVDQVANTEFQDDSIVCHEVSLACHITRESFY